VCLLCCVADVAAVVYYLREDALWSQRVSTAVDGQPQIVGDATHVRNNNATIAAFDIDYNRQLVYWIDQQNKVSLSLYTSSCDVVVGIRVYVRRIGFVIGSSRVL